MHDTPLSLGAVGFILKQQILWKYDPRVVSLDQVAFLLLFFPLRPFPVPKTRHSFFSLLLVLLRLKVFLLCRKLSATLIVFLSWWMLPCLLALSTNTEMPLVSEQPPAGST